MRGPVVRSLIFTARKCIARNTLGLCGIVCMAGGAWCPLPWALCFCRRSHWKWFVTVVWYVSSCLGGSVVRSGMCVCGVANLEWATTKSIDWKGRFGPRNLFPWVDPKGSLKFRSVSHEGRAPESQGRGLPVTLGSTSLSCHLYCLPTYLPYPSSVSSDSLLVLTTPCLSCSGAFGGHPIILGII